MLLLFEDTTTPTTSVGGRLYIVSRFTAALATIATAALFAMNYLRKI